MVSFSFQPEFVRPILTGEKTGTIRRTRRCEPGQKMHLYTGLRTKQCTLIAVKKCTDTLRCIIEPRGIALEKPSFKGESFGMLLDSGARDALAQADGFRDFMDMYEWFLNRYRLEVFHGFLYRWKP